jgi:mono/diheme cytochrome c family protein
VPPSFGRVRLVLVSAALFALADHALAAASSPDPVKKVTYEDDVLPIFRDNCLKCHNPDKLKGDLDLTSFSAAIKGGGSGATLNAGDPEGSQLFKSITHTDEPNMPPNGKLSDKDIGTIRGWIAGGLLQGAGSKALAASKPAVDLSLKAGSIGKPEGPPPMPGALALEPVVHAVRGTALAGIAHSPWAPVVALAAAKQIVLYNTSDLEFVGVLPFPQGFPCDVKFSRNGRLLLASGGRGGQSGLVTVWDITTGETVITVGDQFDSVLAADLSGDQQWIALGGPDRILKVYRTRDGALEYKMKKHTEWVTAVEFSPDSKYLASGDRNGGVVLWEAESGHELFTLPGHKGGITSITWRGDSELFASASEDGTIKLWRASDGTALRSINAHKEGVLAARFSHDGKIVSCGRDNKVQLWESTGKNVRTLAFKGDLPTRVSFSDDDKKVIGSDWKGQVFVWDATSGKQIGELDATPPTMAERVNRITQRVAELEKAAHQAATAHATHEAEVMVLRAKLDHSRQTLAAARKGQALPTEVAARQKEIAALTKEVAAADKKAAEANATVDDTRTQLAQTRTSLARWQTALQGASTKPAPRKVSLR